MKQTKQLTCSAIVAMAKNRVIGHHNQLLWRLPADLKRFKMITTGYPIIMGRKTYESIGKPLPNRINIVLTRNPMFQAQGCLVARTIQEAVNHAALYDTKLFIIGGSDIYQQFLPEINRIFLTIVDHEFEGDAYFPALNPQEWQEVFSEEHGIDANHAYPFRFVVLERQLKRQHSL
jgi:dihydrofolate reductase